MSAIVRASELSHVLSEGLSVRFLLLLVLFRTKLFLLLLLLKNGLVQLGPLVWSRRHLSAIAQAAVEPVKRDDLDVVTFERLLDCDDVNACASLHIGAIQHSPSDTWRFQCSSDRITWVVSSVSD